MGQGFICSREPSSCDGSFAGHTLDLSGVSLSGTVPCELGRLTALTTMYLYYTSLSGTLPCELGSLHALQALSLLDTSLSGTIPGALMNLSELQLLDLSLTAMSGTIPRELGSSSTLESLNLYDNQMSGTIPRELGRLSMLDTLFLWRSYLSGTLPCELGSLSLLEQLDLSTFFLSGTIPCELGRLAAASGIDMSGTSLSGTIPCELGSLSTLQLLALFRSRLSGLIPCELGSLKLHGCYLTCSQNDLCFGEATNHFDCPARASSAACTGNLTCTELSPPPPPPMPPPAPPHPAASPQWSPEVPAIIASVVTLLLLLAVTVRCAVKGRGRASHRRAEAGARGIGTLQPCSEEDPRRTALLSSFDGDGGARTEVRLATLDSASGLRGGSSANDSSAIVTPAEEAPSVHCSLDPLLARLSRVPSAGEEQLPALRGEGVAREEGDAARRVAPEIPACEMQLLRLIGCGGFGIVREAIWLGTHVAVKQTRLRALPHGLLAEASVLAQLRHPCICSFFGICNLDGSFALVLELMAGSLHQLLFHSSPTLCPGTRQRCRIAQEAASGLAYLHRNHFMHRDVKPANVLLDGMLHAKVNDFGISKQLVAIDESLEGERSGRCCTANTGRCGTKKYMAPEVAGAASNPEYSESCDVYSYGLTLWELLHKERLPPQRAQMQRPPVVLPEELEGLDTLITACWHDDPQRRPSMKACADELAALLRKLPREASEPFSWEAAPRSPSTSRIVSVSTRCSSTEVSRRIGSDSTNHHTAKVGQLEQPAS